MPAPRQRARGLVWPGRHARRPPTHECTCVCACDEALSGAAGCLASLPGHRAKAEGRPGLVLGAPE